jgi:Domain of unknown function (DUF4351)
MLGFQPISKACRKDHSKQPNKTSEREEAMVLTTSWKEEGRVEEATNIVLRQLTRKISGISPDALELVRALSVSQLEELADALLDFSTPEDLAAWLTTHPST